MTILRQTMLRHLLLGLTFLAAPSWNAAAMVEIVDRPILRETLANGTAIITQQRPGCGTFAITLVALGGRAEDPPEQIGLTEVMASMLLRGTTRRSADDQAIEVERTGATLDAVGGMLGIWLRASGPSAALSPTLDVILDAATHPRLEAVDLAKEIALARQRLARSLDLASTQRERAMLGALFGDHPLGRVPDPATYLRSVDVATLRRAHEARFTGARLIVVLVGEFEPFTAREAIEASLAGLPSGQPPPQLTHPSPLGQARSVRVHRRTSQPELVVGLPTPGLSDTDEPAMDLLQHLLAGFQERLSTEIRETRGWAYWLAPLDWRFPGAGAFGILTAVPKKHLTEASRIIEDELDRIAATPPSSEELERARRYLLTSKARAWQRCADRAADYANATARAQAPRTYEETAARYQQVTPEDVRRLATALLEQSHLAVVTMY